MSREEGEGSEGKKTFADFAPSVFNLCFICGLNSALLRRPDYLVELRLEAHGQRVGDDAFD